MGRLTAVVLLIGLAACDTPQNALEKRAEFEGGRSGIELAVHQCVEREARAVGRRYSQEVSLSDAKTVAAISVLACSANMERLRGFLLTGWSPVRAEDYMIRLTSRLQGDVVRLLPIWIKEDRAKT